MLLSQCKLLSEPKPCMGLGRYLSCHFYDIRISTYQIYEFSEFSDKQGAAA